MPFNLSKRPSVKIGIEMSDYCQAAKSLSLPVARIRAVDEVESAGSGFLSDSARPKILFEGHLFYRSLGKLGLAEKARKLDPTVCYPAWTKKYYIGRNGEYARLASATEICHKLKVSDAVALAAASWGRYQILGSNYAACGFDSVEDYVEAMFLDEDNHLEAFVEYLDATGLDEVLRKGLYEKFAARYNGPGYKRNGYQIKIPNAVRKFEKQRVDCKSTEHVVSAMPGERFTNPEQDGFENTSMDDRHTEAPEPSDTGGDDTKAGSDGKNGSQWQETPNAEASTTINMPGSGSQTTDTQKKIEAASNLPDISIPAKIKTGFTKLWAFIYAVITGTILIPSWIQSGITFDSIRGIGGLLWDSRYLIAGVLLIWFIVTKYESITLRKKAIDANTNPEKGNVVLTSEPPDKSIWSTVKGWFGK